MQSKQDFADQASAVDKIIEQKTLDGEIEGIDFFTEEEQQAALAELAELRRSSQIAYERRRNELQPWFGCTKEAINAEVKLIIEQQAPADRR
jgi:hypothetical protein